MFTIVIALELVVVGWIHLLESLTRAVDGHTRITHAFRSFVDSVWKTMFAFLIHPKSSSEYSPKTPAATPCRNVDLPRVRKSIAVQPAQITQVPPVDP